MRTTKKQPGKVQEMPGTAVAEPPEPAEPATKPLHRPRQPEAPLRKHATFFERIANIVEADWGTRAKVKVYRLDPIIDRTRGSENKYICVYHEPVDEEKIKADHGSGRYRLYFNYKEPAGADKEIDMVEIEILDVNFPPKVPPGEWVDDPRNKKWGWARKLEAAPGMAQQASAPPAVETFLEAARVVTDIQNTARADYQSQNPPPAAPPAAAPVNTMSDTLNLVDKIMTMKADNPMGELYRDEMRALRDELKAEREESRRLQREIRDAQAAPKIDETGGIEGMLDKLEKVAPKLQSLLGLGGEKLTDVVHGRKRSFWEELGLQVLPPIASNVAPLIPILAGRFLSGPPSNPLAPAQPPQQQQQNIPAAAPNPMQETQTRVASFLGANLTPMRRVFEDYMRNTPRDPDDAEAGKIDGSDFAAWVHEYHGEAILKDARSLGSGNILMMFKNSPLWPQLAPYEVKLAEFLDQALRYDPPVDEPQAVEEEKTVEL